MLQEYVIGMQPSEVTLTPNSNLLELILVTERTHKIVLSGCKIDGDDVLAGIEIDGGAIDLRVREKSNAKTSEKSITLKTPFVDSIVLQQTLYSASDQPHLYWRRITYIKIETGGEMVEIGEERDTTDSVAGSHLILTVERVDDPCMISGVGFHNGDIVCLQIIAAPGMKADYISEHMYAHGKSKVGLIALTNNETLKMVEHNHFVGLEDFDRTYDVIMKFYCFMRDWYSSRASVNRMYAAFYDLIDTSISEQDTKIIFSVLRLERNLRWRINTEYKSSHAFDSDPFRRLKLHQVMQCLASTMESCQRTLVGKPSLNCYAVAYLSGELSNYLVATVVLIVQISLTFLLFQSIRDNESGTENFAMKESYLITPIIAVFSTMLVYKQISNIFDLRKAYPEMHKTSMGLYDIIANGFLGLAILIIQIAIIVKQTSRLDFVLNAIATLFILELDDNAVFIGDDGKTDLNRQILLKEFDDRIKKIDEKYFNFGDWKTARNHYEIDSDKCELVSLPDINFNNDDKNDAMNIDAEPVCIEMKEEQMYEDGRAGWLEIASSGTITNSMPKEDSKAELFFEWRDQGYGNRKGKLRVRLVSVMHGNDVASTPEYGIAPHEYEMVHNTFDCRHGMVRFCTQGYKYVIEVHVGGGGGHQLFLKNLKFTQLTAFAQPADVYDDNKG